MLFSERLSLDRPRNEDFTRYYEINSDPQTNLFNPKGPMDFDTARTRFDGFLQHWEERDFGSWVVRLKDSGHIIGFGGLSYLMYGDQLRLNLGYRFDQAAWHKGYATELSRFAIAHGFSDLRLSEIYALVRPSHSVSIKILEKCGLTSFGTLDDAPGQHHSLVYRIENPKAV
ncbi:GNAT family N-acetyltransferase [Flavobacterium sp. MAH-1]|uniref:GNAT family N-acetyltransferase n=1 Tax=Flavobacterium agri TaxID=2743471 RepID=A0A7Y8XZ34_9FLAO|nr:GNAT family N-acetyltransferase [Flavobacterium agri]NUY79373.1 GNAT family N-acetyltransferase [Flavobacterium agri]NYA69397.1 GNAT family N-acetyltransferase [Flavobacterium agri]